MKWATCCNAVPALLRRALWSQGSAGNFSRKLLQECCLSSVRLRMWLRRPRSGETRTSRSRPLPRRHAGAVRRGRPHWSEPASDGILCAHFGSPDAVAVLCVPMMAQSEVVGVLHLQYGPGCATGKGGDQESFHKSQETLASAVAGQIALALASLRLRETLREQSIRDPLTGLFNRRIMQESLNRELHRAR